MSSPNTVSTPAKPIILMPKGGRLWYFFKFLECVLVVSCLFILLLTQCVHDVVDDFTLVKTKNTTHPVETNTTMSFKNPISVSNKLITKSRRADKIISRKSSETSNPTRLRDEDLKSELMNWDTHIRMTERLKRVKKVSDKEELGNGIKHKASYISLNDLLIMFPCSTTLLMVIAMEILGEIFKDPLGKLSNLILILLAILLAIILFTISLLAYLRSAHITLILITIVSGFLVVIEFINFILFLLS